ncbi:hypothetical protein DBR47_13265 [Paucibacter sp. KBW04]|nr:hypothetical protein DBR47_13265 [Paucibacter sp. KBW04]
MVFAGISYVRGLQAQSVTVHAMTQAQMKAWSGAEALRQFLFHLKAKDLEQLSLGSPVQFAGLEGVEAKVSRAPSDDPINCKDGKVVGFEISGSSGGASTLLANDFCLKPAKSTVSSPKAVINIRGDLSLRGNIEVLGGDKAKVLVDGKVVGSGSLSGISFLQAKGDVELSGSSSNGIVFSEQNILLSGSGSYNALQAMGNIQLSGTVSAASAIANGAISLRGNQVTDLRAIGPVTLAGDATVGMLRTKSNVHHQGVKLVNQAFVEGDYLHERYGPVNGGQYRGQLSGPSRAENRMTRNPNLLLDIPALTPATLDTPTFDAYPYKSMANYVFERQGGDTKVTVRSVSHVLDGTYFLVGSGGNQDYLCTSNRYSPSSCVAKICTGYSDYNSCFQFDAASQTWKINGAKDANKSISTMVPGVLWFEGNVEAGTGNYHNTWLATGNLKTQGEHLSYSVNYADYAWVCKSSRYSRLAPSNFCLPGQAELQSVSAGNICFGAGGVKDGNYLGGKITLAASAEVFGDVVAGDILETGGSTVIHGFISAANLGSTGDGSSLKASTRVDLSNLPKSFQPGEHKPAASSLLVTLLWSRYQ